MQPKTISFYRQYYGYTGGHQKVRDYLSHTLSLGYKPSLYLENKAITNKGLFSTINGVNYQNNYQPGACDIVFLAGMDWQAFLASNATHKPVVNLIQHVRHADRNEALFDFLSRPAIRICVSDAVKEAIQPYANGPCYTVKMGHTLPTRSNNKTIDLYILANKQPELGQTVYKWAQSLGIKALIHNTTTEKHSVHQAMADARVTLALPHKTEGFYLPGIEGMWASDMVVVPNCVANKEYHHSWSNLLIPEYSLNEIKSSVKHAMQIKGIELAIRKFIGQRIARQYSLQNECREFGNILTRRFG